MALLFSFLFLVGIGTFAFHSTLDKNAQLLDELPMLFGAANSMLVSFNIPKNHKVSTSLLVNAICISACVLYIVNDNPVFHEVVFGLFILGSFFIGLFQTRKLNKKKLTLRNRYSPAYIMKRTGFYAALGFALWNLDNHFCDNLIWVRSYIPFPFDGLFQLHAWWHWFTSLAAVYAINGFLFIRFLLMDVQCHIIMRYHILPTIIFTQKFE